MYELKIREIGNSCGVVLPKELLAQLKVKNGDVLFASETSNGVKITAYNPEDVSKMTTAEAIIKKRRNLLKALAGS